MIHSLRIDKFMYHTYNLFMTRISSRIYENACSNHIKFQIRYFKIVSVSNSGTGEQNKQKKKTVRIPNIKLVHPDGSVTITVLEQAQKIAKSRSFHLVKESYLDTDARDVYVLHDNRDVFGDKLDKGTKKNTKENVNFKSTKYFHIKSKISEHDLGIKVNNMNKLLQKNYKISLVITFPPGYIDKETMIQNMKAKVQGKIIEEKTKGNSFILLYQPLLISSNADKDIN